MGVGENGKTTIKLLRPEQVWQPRLGAPIGNRNAAKAVPSLAMLRARVRALKRRIKAVMGEARPQSGQIGPVDRFERRTPQYRTAKCDARPGRVP